MDDYRGYTVRTARIKLLRAFVHKESLISKRENIYFGGEKTFMVNSVINWCLKRRAKRFFSLTDLQYYVTLIQKYIDDEIEFSWSGETLIVQIKEK